MREDAMNESTTGERTQGPGIQGTVVRSVLAVAASFAFAIGVLPPMYDLICEITGVTGKTGGQYVVDAEDLQADGEREVSVRFITNSNAGMPWHFDSSRNGMKVNPGGINEAIFVAHNPTDRIMVAQAIPSVAPGRAAAYFHKTQCFCFDQQVLEPGESIDMPVRYIVDRDLPASIGTITLSYTLFDITDSAAGRYALEEYEASGNKLIPGTGPGDAVGEPVIAGGVAAN